MNNFIPHNIYYTCIKYIIFPKVIKIIDNIIRYGDYGWQQGGVRTSFAIPYSIFGEKIHLHPHTHRREKIHLHPHTKLLVSIFCIIPIPIK